MRNSKKIFIGHAILVFVFLALPGIVNAENWVQPRVDLQIPLLGTQTIFPCNTHSGELVCDGLSTYIVVLYQLAIRAGAIFAVLMLMYAGVRWLASAGESKHVEEAKKTMKDALIGLLLVLMSHSLLWLINPDLVNLKSLAIGNIGGVPLEIDDAGEGAMEADGSFAYSHATLPVSTYSNLRFTAQAKQDIDNGVGNANLLSTLERLNGLGIPLSINYIKTGHKGTKSLHYSGMGIDVGGTGEDLVKAGKVMLLFGSHSSGDEKSHQIIRELYVCDDRMPKAILNDHNGGGEQVSLDEFKRKWPDLCSSHKTHLHIGVKE